MKQRAQSGFTLVEIAIVLVIVGLLLGGVLKGQALIDSAKVRNAISQMDGMKAAMFAFQDRYRALPGDMANASTVVGNGAVDCTGSGCGDGVIRPWAESSIVTNNLSAAGLYKGNFATAVINAAPTAETAPTNPWGGPMMVGYWVYYATTATTVPSANGIYTGKMPNTVLAEIDRKIDDGLPKTGSFRGGYPYQATATCISGNAWVTAVANPNCAGVEQY